MRWGLQFDVATNTLATAIALECAPPERAATCNVIELSTMSDLHEHLLSSVWWHDYGSAFVCDT